jgi:hypothetical protein
MTRPGRKRKAGVTRYSNGHIAGPQRGEREAEVIELAVSRRAREVGEQDAKDPMAGYALGRLCLAGKRKDPHGISVAQHDAGLHWARVVSRYASVKGIALPLTRSGGFEMVARGMSCGEQPSAEQITVALRAYNDAYAELRFLDPLNGAPIKVCRDVCIQDRHEHTLSPDDLGNLRCGLNVLAKLYGMRA